VYKSPVYVTRSQKRLPVDVDVCSNKNAMIPIFTLPTSLCRHLRRIWRSCLPTLAESCPREFSELPTASVVASASSVWSQNTSVRRSLILSTTSSSRVSMIVLFLCFRKITFLILYINYSLSGAVNAVCIY